LSGRGIVNGGKNQKEDTGGVSSFMSKGQRVIRPIWKSFMLRKKQEGVEKNTVEKGAKKLERIGEKKKRKKKTRPQNQSRKF